MENQIYDYVGVNDSCSSSPIKGIVKIYDEKGNLIFNNHNLVVKDGRKILYSLFAQYVIKSTINTINITGATFNEKTQIYVNFSYLNSGITTTADLQLADIETTGDYIEITNAGIDLDVANLAVTFKADISGSESFTKFNNIYLTTVVDESGTKTRQLFSRVAMDPVFIGSTGKYTLYYTLYF